jgi:hypothetical protein
MTTALMAWQQRQRCQGCGDSLGNTPGMLCHVCDNYHRYVLPGICSEAIKKGVGIMDIYAELRKAAA